MTKIAMNTVVILIFIFKKKIVYGNVDLSIIFESKRVEIMQVVK